MQGRVIHIAADDVDGVIRAEDQKRYPYSVGDWVSLEPAVVGSSVDFEVNDERAKSVYCVPNGNEAMPTGHTNVPKRIIPAIVIASLLLASGIGGLVAYQAGMFSSLGSHGPSKTYSVMNPAKVRNLPTTQGSMVVRELQPGDTFVGRIYLGPDGQSQWIKRDGAEEYVSIVNLAESEVPNVSNLAVVASTISSNPCDNIAGVWRVSFTDGGESVLKIQKSGEVYLLNEHRVTNYSNGYQNFSGSCASGIINTNSLVGNASYLADGDRLVFIGNQYARSSDGEEARRIAEKEAVRLAQVQAQQSKEEEQRLMSAMHLDAYNCGYHFKDSCARTLQDHKSHPELAERVWARNRVTLAQAQNDAVNGKPNRRNQ